MPVAHVRFNGYSVKFSPFVNGRLAVASAQNFGIIGNGRCSVLEVSLQRHQLALKGSATPKRTHAGPQGARATRGQGS